MFDRFMTVVFALFIAASVIFEIVGWIIIVYLAKHGVDETMITILSVIVIAGGILILLIGGAINWIVSGD